MSWKLIRWLEKQSNTEVMKMNDLHELFESFHLLNKQFFTVEPRYNEALSNEVHYITNDVLYPSNK